MPYFSNLDIMLKKFITSRVKISEYQCCKNISTLNDLKFSIFCIIHNYKVRKIRKVFPNRYRTEIRNLYLNVLNFKLLYHMFKKKSIVNFNIISIYYSQTAKVSDFARQSYCRLRWNKTWYSKSFIFKYKWVYYKVYIFRETLNWCTFEISVYIDKLADMFYNYN